MTRIASIIALLLAGCVEPSAPLVMLAPSPDGFKFEDAPIVPEPETKPLPPPIEVEPEATVPPATVPDPPQPGGTAGKSLVGTADSTHVLPALLGDVYFYTAPFDCEPCRRMEADIANGADGIRFIRAQDDAWLAMQNGYPQLRWKVNGKWNGAYHGWGDLAEFLQAYKNSVGSVSQSRLATGEAAHTPMSEVVRVIGLLPKPEIAFADLGCGYDARWCIAAAERWGCKCIGIEIDPGRASAARERVRNLGLDHLITIMEGDAGTVPLSADVGVAYLFPEVLSRLKPRLESFKVLASYLHQPPGLPCTKNGDTWFYRRQVQTAAAPQSGAVWGGMVYSQPLCNSPNCAMCNSIRRQLGHRR